ncbi:MAG: hypothetical protein NWE89_12165 [Candidatus Bathyarchaeota archaeon]|nr:hypothetical protein [Candidatus Bathyarchaeota archaeon]
MSVKLRNLFMITFLVVFMSVAVPVMAASFEGVYNYAYNLRGPEGWEEHRVDSGFIVRSGVISSDPPALSGSVDSSGEAVFTGPSPYGGGSATFTGVIRSDGSGDGSYVDGQGLTGNWAVQRVSGGGSDWASLLLDVMYSFSFIGEFFGLSGTTAASVGAAAVITVVVFTGVILSSIGKGGRGSKRKEYPGFHSRGEYEASQPDSPSGIQGSPASPIGVPPPPQSPPVGITDTIPGLPSGLNLRSDWGPRSVLIDWDELQYDRDRYTLEGYDVIQLKYDGSGTTPTRRTVERLTPENRRWNTLFDQTYRWNTGGDIQGYRIDAVFREINSDSPRFLRVGETSYSPY